MDCKDHFVSERQFSRRQYNITIPLKVTSIYLLMNLISSIENASISANNTRSSLTEDQQANAASGLLDQTNALHYLQRYGYLSGGGANPHNTLDSTNHGQTNNLISEDSFTEAIQSFQRFANIPETGIIDEQTQRYMKLPRCGNSDKPLEGPTAEVRHTSGGDSRQSSEPRIRVARLGNILKNGTWEDFVKRRRKRYALQGSKWRRQELTYRISQYPTRFASKRHEVDGQIEKAFGIWSQVAPINFVVKREGRVHIDIRFASGDHGDGDAFDGPGNTLAHAYFPQYGGDAHFDDGEYWTIDSNAGTNIFQVAAHELGHSLGLGHSNVREALMAPFYQKYKPHFKLHIDDVLAIQALYGEKPLFLEPPPAAATSNQDHSVPSTTTTTTTSTTTTTTTTTTPPPQTGSTGFSIFGNRNPNNKPEVFSGEESEGVGVARGTGPADLCLDSMIDAITRTEDGNSYVFKGDYYWLFTPEGVVRGYPRKISLDWEGLPGNLDAALTWADGKTFFFKGNKYWRFRNKRRDLGYPKLISSGFAGIPNDIDAAFVWSGNGRTYIFKGAQYWRFDSKSEPPVGAEYPRSVKVWNGVPAHINAAFKWENNVTYFFKGQQYYRFNDKAFKMEDRVRPAYPRNSGEWWFGCPGSNSLAAQRVAPGSFISLSSSASGGGESEQFEPIGSAGSEPPVQSMAASQAPPLAASPNDWSFFSGFDSEIQQPKIVGTHISDKRPPEQAVEKPEQVGGPGESVAEDLSAFERQLYNRIGLSSRQPRTRGSQTNNSNSFIAITRQQMSLFALLSLLSTMLVFRATGSGYAKLNPSAS